MKPKLTIKKKSLNISPKNSYPKIRPSKDGQGRLVSKVSKKKYG